MAMHLIQPSDRFFVAGARGMAGSAIVRALQRSGYGDRAQGGELLTPSRQELDLLDDAAVRHWMNEQRPDVVVLAAATVGGIEANRSRPADFLLENLRIETQVIEAAWRASVCDRWRRLPSLCRSIRPRSQSWLHLAKGCFRTLRSGHCLAPWRCVILVRSARSRF